MIQEDELANAFNWFLVIINLMYNSLTNTLMLKLKLRKKAFKL